VGRSSATHRLRRRDPDRDLVAPDGLVVREMRTRNRPLFARFYAWVSPRMDEGGVLEHRRTLLTGLSGRVIEVGAGNGLNFEHYPTDVTSVVAVEPLPHLRRLAAGAAERVSTAIEVIDGVAEHLPAEAESFDAAVVSLVLCSVSDQRTALREIYRVLRPGGALHFFEHVRADTPGLRFVQAVLDATVWPLVAGGCHTGRDTTAELVRAGFIIERLERVQFPDLSFSTPTSLHIIGVARRPTNSRDNREDRDDQVDVHDPVSGAPEGRV
jgi:SAM-dependent methyltransferase